MSSLQENVRRGVPLATLALFVGACVAYLVSVDSQTFLEPAFAQHVRDWTSGRPLYEGLAESPHNLAVYGPLYYALIAPFSLLSRSWGIVLGIRVISVASIVMSFVATRTIVRSLVGRSNTESALPFIVPLGLSFGILWPSSGPTWPACAFELAGLALACRPTSERKVWAAYAAFILATLVKQNAVGVVAGVALSRCLRKQGISRRGVVESVAFAVVLLVVHLGINGVTHGAYRRALYLTAVADSKSAWTAFNVTRGVFVSGAIAVGLAVLGPRGSVTDGESRRTCTWATIFAALVALTGVSKSGAGPGYFLSTVFCISGLACASVSDLDSSRQGIVALALAVSLWPSREQLSAWKQQLLDRHPFKAEVALLRSTPAGPILSELPIVAQIAGRDAWVADPYLYSLAVERGLSSNGLVADLVRCRLAAVLLFRQSYPAKPAFLLRNDEAARSEVLFALTNHYREGAGTDDFRIFLPGCDRARPDGEAAPDPSR